MPNPSIRNGTAVNRAPVGGSWSRPVRCSTIGTPALSSSVCRALAIVGVVDVNRVDTDQSGTMAGKPGGSGASQEVRLVGVCRCPESGIIPGVQEDSLAADVKCRQRAYANAALARTGHSREYGRHIDGAS